MTHTVCHDNNRGQALVMLLVFVIVSITITSASVSLMILNSSAASTREVGAATLAIAEAGAEEALLRIVRDPEYVGGTLTIGLGHATVEVSGTSPKTIMSRGEDGAIVRAVEVVTTVANGVWTVISWREVFL